MFLPAPLLPHLLAQTRAAFVHTCLCKYPCCLVKLLRAVIIIYKPNVQNGMVANPPFCIAVALHQTVVSIRLLFVFIIPQAELEMHRLQNSDSLPHKPTPLVYYKINKAFVREVYDFVLYLPTEYGLKKNSKK